MRRQSLKRQREQRQRRALLRRLVETRGPWCEAGLLGCRGLADDAHEVLTRARGGSIVDPSNIKLLCRPCHDWVGAHPDEAERLGLLRHSWDRGVA